MSNELVKHESGAVATHGVNVLELIGKAAADPSVDVAKMNALLDFKQRIEKDQAEREFNQDLVAVQAEVPRVSKDGRILNKAGNVQSRYARYEDIDKVLRPLMKQYGFAVTFNNPDFSGGAMRFTATLRHRGGHSVDYHMALPADTSGGKNVTQGAGSTTSYAKRYLLCSIFNIITEGEDNDGNPETITEDQLMTLETLIRDARANVPRILDFAGVQALKDIPASKYGSIIKGLQSRVK